MKSLSICCWLLFAIALRPSRSSLIGDVATDSSRMTVANGTEPRGQQSTIATEHQRNSTTAGPQAVVVGADNNYDVGGGGSANERVAELYEDLEDTVVFEDSEKGGGGVGGGSRMLDEHQHLHPAVDHGAPPQLDEHVAAAASAEEYEQEQPAGEEDATPAGSSAVARVQPSSAQRSVGFPEYVRSSSYRKGWSGGNVTHPERLFRFWDPYEWTATSSSVSAQCADHMEQYQKALRNGKMWAFKSK